mmetsp:Transcript_27814/g.28061  ORF Transcript_27814/g.28061 Transcript_27814/m.28061 type:complete len:447 (+) Transcript_27814:91-1431(+)
MTESAAMASCLNSSQNRTALEFGFGLQIKTDENCSKNLGKNLTEQNIQEKLKYQSDVTAIENFQSNICVPVDVMSSGECRSTIHDRLYQMMEMSRGVILDINGLAKFSHVAKVSQHRANAIRWIKDVVSLSHVSVETRDSSIQIFDRFLGACLSENKNILGHSTDVALAAAVSVLISSKMHETRPLSMSSFPHLKTTDLILFEKLVISKLGYLTFPLASPVTFIRYLLSLWTDGSDYPYLVTTACDLVGEFFEAPEAPHFAPSAVALSALLLSFSKLGMDCSEWLEHVPNICLPSPSHPIFQSSFMVSFLDVDNCLSVFQRIQSAHNKYETFNYVTPQTPLTSPLVVERLISPNSVCGNLSPTKSTHTINPKKYDSTPNTNGNVQIAKTSNALPKERLPSVSGTVVSPENLLVKPMVSETQWNSNIAKHARNEDVDHQDFNKRRRQ